MSGTSIIAQIFVPLIKDNNGSETDSPKLRVNSFLFFDRVLLWKPQAVTISHEFG